MGLHVLKDCTAWIGSHDFSGESNEVRFNMDVDQQECTTFGSGGFREYKAGLRELGIDMKGFWQAGADTVDSDAFTNLGTANDVATFTETGVAGEVAYMAQAGRFAYQVGGTHGEMAPYSLQSKGTDGVGTVRGYLAKAKGTVSATGALGSGVQLGAVGASQYLYATFHVFGTPGTTITTVLESDDNAGFSSATTRATLGPYTTAGGRWMTRVAGAITDDYFRFRVTAITGTFTVGAAFAVQ